ncbi:MAG TPA: magnesium-translocating P-type ATPase [Candidatus Omnitrophota bacterium]|nr:magnesium-translocating P-type ATPase [Candidatus Omnitrophota bacterium]
MEKEGEQDYWNKKEQEIFGIFNTSEKGLSNEQIELQKKKYGYNELKRKKPAIFLFFRQFKSPLIWLFIIISIISMFFGELISAVIILIIVSLTSLFSFLQEYRSEKTVSDLNKKISHKAIAIRDNEKIEIDVKELVPGDLIVLNIGDKVPADLRIIESKNLEIDESILTGESVPVRKISSPVKKAARIQDYANYAFEGTIISNGEALAVVLYTGNETQIGKLSKEVVQPRPQVQFQKGIGQFVNFLIYIVLATTFIIFVANFILKQNLLDSLLFALAIAIGISPEMLPVIITVGLARGGRIMAKKEVIVKRLISIEDLGNMDILCTDKTGTLTEGNTKVHSFIDFEGKTKEEILLYSILCNSAVIHGKKISGNPIDAAILQHDHSKMESLAKSYAKIDEIPFDYERKRMSVIVQKKNEKLLISKGSPRLMLKVCSKVDLNGRVSSISPYHKKIEDKFLELSSQGLRVIAVAYKSIDKKTYGKNDEKSLIFMGFIVFSDPPKVDIKDSLEKLKLLNIDFKILTGDNEIVTKKIAEDVGISISRIVLGDEIEKYDSDELAKACNEANIFCRLTPMQKKRIIQVLKDSGHDVGYLGDGVNDVAALHEADVGISVDSAVDVAKDASDIVLLKKSLSILAGGVIEGRKVFSNSMKYIMIGVSSDFGNMISMAIGSFVLPFLPLLPPQVLLNDLIYDVSQMPVSWDNVDHEYLKKPKKFNLNLIKKYMLWFGPLSTIYDLIALAILVFFFKASEISVRTGWFVESISTQILVFFIIRTRKSPFWKSKPGKGVLISCLSMFAFALMVPYTPLGTIFQLTPLPPLYFAFLAGMIITYLLIAEIGKRIFFKKYEI